MKSARAKCINIVINEFVDTFLLTFAFVCLEVVKKENNSSRHSFTTVQFDHVH